MVSFKAKIRLFQKQAEENKGRVHPALPGYTPQINFEETLFACRIESAEKILNLETDYHVQLILGSGQDYPLEWYQPGNKFKLNEASRIVGEGVILGDVCLD